MLRISFKEHTRIYQATSLFKASILRFLGLYALEEGKDSPGTNDALCEPIGKGDVG